MKFNALKSAVCRALIAVALWHGVTLSAAQILIAPTAAPQPTLCAHLSAQLTSREAGNSAAFMLADYSMVTNFWLRDVTNILGNSLGQLNGAGGSWNAYACWSVPVSPHFVIGAAHAGGQGSSNGVWMLPGGILYSNKGAYLGAQFQNASVNDIEITLMANTNAFFLKYLPDISAKCPYVRTGNIAASPAPVFVRFHFSSSIGWPRTSFISNGDGYGNFSGNLSLWGVPRFGDYSQGDYWIGGDSGGAAFAIINNEAVLVGCAHYTTACPAVWQYAAQINAVMAALCASNGLAVETLTAYDLSQFPNL